MNVLGLLAQGTQSTQTHEGWFVVAVLVMVFMNIIGEVVKNKIFPPKPLKDDLDFVALSNIAAGIAKAANDIKGAVDDIKTKTEELHKWHDDPDPNTGIQRWKVTLMQEEIKKQTECLKDIKESQIKQEAHLSGMRQDVKAMTTAIQGMSVGIQAMTGRYKTQSNPRQNG